MTPEKIQKVFNIQILKLGEKLQSIYEDDREFSEKVFKEKFPLNANIVTCAAFTNDAEHLFEIYNKAILDNSLPAHLQKDMDDTIENLRNLLLHLKKHEEHLNGLIVGRCAANL